MGQYFRILSLAIILFTSASQAKFTSTSEVDVCPLSDTKPDKLLINNDPETPLVDNNREIKDFNTNFVVTEFLRSKDTLLNFMKLVYETVDESIKNYRLDHNLNDQSIIFLFKGGNVLRMLANRMLSMTPLEVRERLLTQYGDVIKRSDADYTILINKNRLGNLSYDKVLDDITNTTYEALNRIRDEFTENPDKYFNFTQLKASRTKAILDSYLSRLKDLKSIADPANDNWYSAQFKQMQLLDARAKDSPSCRYVGSPDYSYVTDPNDANKIIGTPIGDSSHWIMNTINRTLTWPSAKGNLTIAFHLVRSKLQIEFTYVKDGEVFRKPIGGELIDVSIPLENDFRMPEFFAKLNEWVANYSLTNEETGDSFQFKAESIEGVTADLYDVLFEQNDRPWNAAKYQKRIKRLFLLGIGQLMGTWGIGSKKINEYIADVREQLVAPLRSLYPLNSSSRSMARALTRSSKTLADRYSQLSSINRIWHGMAEVVDDELVENPKDGDQEQLNGLIETIESNLNAMSDLADMTPQVINLEKAYQATIDNLL